MSTMDTAEPGGAHRPGAPLDGRHRAHPRSRRGARRGRGRLIPRTPEGARWRPGPAPADVTVSGEVLDLLLVFTRRRPPEEGRVTVTGDRAVLDHWLANTTM